jgi:hypothetical protein
MIATFQPGLLAMVELYAGLLDSGCRTLIKARWCDRSSFAGRLIQDAHAKEVVWQGRDDLETDLGDSY